MNKLIIFFLTSLFICSTSLSRNAGETEITTEDGIEVFQEEKYYLLKKNVKILSDELELSGQIVKVFFEEGLYDIKKLIATDTVYFKSDEYNMSGKGNYVDFDIKNQKIIINGINSELYLENTEMMSDGKIMVDNLNSSFFINGNNSKLISDKIFITGEKINGSFEIINGKRDVASLIVEDDKLLNIKTNNILMYAKKAVYDKKKSIIELFEDVKINRGSEIITGDYGILDMKKDSYKVLSNKSNKVKAIIIGSNE